MIELVPLEDYLFHYERGVFWMACYGWAPTLWNRFTRWFFDAVWHTRFQYRILHLTGGAPYIIQDVAIPAQNDVKEVPLRAVLKAMVWAGLGLDKLVG
jgi:delta24-sterol reductase